MAKDRKKDKAKGKASGTAKGKAKAKAKKGAKKKGKTARKGPGKQKPRQKKEEKRKKASKAKKKSNRSDLQDNVDKETPDAKHAACGEVSSMNIVLLGPPGAGKGTQAERLEKELCLAHVASGDLFRENLGNETELGLLAKTYMDRGELVPDDVTIAMVGDRLGRPDCEKGIILDGFPRTLAQAEGLDGMLADLGRSLTGVLYIAVPDEELVQRLSGRWICRQCQTPFHSTFSPPAKEGTCDACGGELYQRDDDKPDTVRARLQVFHEQTAPLIGYYRKKDALVEVDGSGDIDTVSTALLKAACDLQGGYLEPCCGQCTSQE